MKAKAIDWFRGKALAEEQSAPEVCSSNDRSGPVPTSRAEWSPPIPTDLSKPEPPISPKRRPPVAINCFVESMQGFALIGEFGWRPLPSDPKRAGIYKYYLEHCAAERTTPLPAHTFQQWLAKHPAVQRYQVKAGASELTAYFIHDSIDRHWINNEGDRDAERPPH